MKLIVDPEAFIIDLPELAVTSSVGGGVAKCETVSATYRFRTIPTVPMSSGEMPRNQLAGLTFHSI